MDRYPDETNPTAMLPLDPDVEVDPSPTGPPRPLHLRPSSLTVVFLGGTAGVAAREALTLALGPPGAVHWATFAINLTGAFLLGLLLEALVRCGPDHGRRRTLRLLVGTGFLGGYTTYSALATDTADLVGSGAVGEAVGYGLGTVLVGALATWLGIILGAVTGRPRSGSGS